MDFLTSQTHLHITTWVVAIVLFLVAAMMQKGTKGRKVTHMILRVFYILVIITGAALFGSAMDYSMGMQYGLKFLGGILVIGMMEMVLVRSAKGKPTSMFWILFAVFLLFTLYMGFHLPMGSKLF
ncbi:YisL family protein [Viridibacillus sp. YIM B01967]|uniref:UPF0344 protein JFL43_08395 n=1 Tax=Viridibacillus soli TaxID=2798301 RepID=A0ABS1H6F0_9BACL|nr:YisL family protein [Viridibacillus soli]MBK3494879.1 YisL family protein [Viridibacillus soli]